MKIKEADDIEEKLNEVERLLKNTINMPCKVRVARGLGSVSGLVLKSRCLPTKTLMLQFSRSEVMLTFFERSPLDQLLRNDKVHRIQPCFQSPVKISGQRLFSPDLWPPDSTAASTSPPVSLLEIMRSNGFCLANTETIVFDQSPPEEKDRPSSTDSVEQMWVGRTVG